MILVLWEESFKSLEADYNNHLASPLVASCGEISPSPRIRCDKIKSPTRDAVLGHLETGHPKNKAPFGRASEAASRAAPGEALPNVCFVTAASRVKPVLKQSAAYTGKVKP